MMLYPPVSDLVKKVGSRYQLVNLVARRARAIAERAESEGESLEKKPVSSAIDEVYTGRLSIIEGERTEV
jgi:DNA-directed RNA polymerase subunit omega